MKLRLLVVARRFWPFCDESCYRLVQWTSNLRRSDIEVTVLTSRGHASWPVESDCREVKVVRLFPNPKSSWNEALFVRNVGTWIVKHRDQFDTIYVDESQALLHHIGSRNIRGELPLLARYAGVQSTMVNGMRDLSSIPQAVEGCRKANIVIAPTAIAHRQLHSSGIMADRIVRIPDIAWQPQPRTKESRRAAAAALHQVNQDLWLPSDFKLLLYIGGLDPRANLEALIQAAITRLERDRDFHLWLVGEGRDLRYLYDLVKNHAQHRNILFHSSFDDLDELMQLADAIVCPHDQTGNEYILPTAIAAGIPIMAIESSPYHSVMPASLHPHLLRESSRSHFEKSISDWLSNPAAWKERAEVARREWVANNFSEQAIRLWLKVLKGEAFG